MNKKLNLQERILSSKFFKTFQRVTKKIILPGFDGMPLYDVIVFFVKGLVDGEITTRASSIAFKFFIAMFPAIIFLFTLIPYIPIENFQTTLLEQLHDAVPENFYVLISSTITDIVSRQQGGLLSLGFVLAFYFASNGFLGVIVAFNSTSHIIETRKLFQQYFISIILMIIISILIFASTSLMLIGSRVLNYLVIREILNGDFVIFALKFGKWIVILLMIFFSISFMYFLGPAKKQRFRFISAGSTLATLLFIATTLGFNFYVENFSNYNALYGSIGTIIVIMMWLYLNSISLLVGFELNASISSAKKNQDKENYLKSL